MKELTLKQLAILRFIKEFAETMEMAPTVAEAAEHFRIKESTMFAHLLSLQKKGCITRTEKARTLKIVPEKFPSAGKFSDKKSATHDNHGKKSVAPIAKAQSFVAS